MHRSRFLVLAFAFLLFTFSSPAKASAQCGDDGQLACYPWICDVRWYDLCLFGHYDLTQPSCDSGLEAILGFCQHCGAEGQFVCPSRGCNAGLMNVLGFCVACGGDLQPACSTGCDPDGRFNNILGVCVACGADAQVACQQGSPCDAGHSQVLGSCYLCGQAGQVACASAPLCASDRLNETLGFCIACGGNLQPLCESGASCDPGFTAIAGVCVPGECGGPYQVTCAEPAPLCDGDRFNAIPAVPTLGLCIPCGHDGLPVCLNGRPCDRFNAEAGVGDVAVCKRFSPETEPGTGAVATVPPAASPDAEIFGFADIHTHMLANLGFGGMMVSGAPFDPDGITYALPWCDFTQDFAAENLLGLPVTPVPFFGVPVHGPLHANDLLGSILGEAFASVQGGSSQRDWLNILPEGQYDSWPSWKSVDHQLMYHKWLERAYLGGQRLMVMLAVNNHLICELINRRASYGPNGTFDVFSCSDQDAFERQIAAAKEMEEYIDSLNGGDGWFKIAYSAHEAREIINRGKMAVILGLEAATIFDSKGNDGRTPDIDAQLQDHDDLGARWVFPIHLWDNDFGGAAIEQAVAYPANFASAGYWLDINECGPGYGDYGFQFDAQDLVARLLLPLTGIPIWPLHSADCNARGLTPLGEQLMEKLMAKKMIIDVDHFSKKALDQVLMIAERHHYPLVASHTRFFDVTHGQERHEAAKTAVQVTRLRDLGGIVAPILAPVPGNQISEYGTVPNDCAGSSRQWAQQYLFAVDQMSGGPYQLPAVAFGSDFNAPIRHIAPRFGADGCMGEPAGVHHQAQTNPVVYPFEAYGNPGSSFSRQQTGSRVFDFNTDGLAHVGLLPDLIQDMRNSGTTDAQLEPLFHSAEAVVQMWERIDASTPPPSASYTVSPPPNANGWNNTPVTVTITGSPATGGADIQQVRYSVGGADPITVPGPTAAVPIATEGVTDISFTVEDTAGHVTAPQTAQVMIDMTRPTALAERSQPPNGRGWHRSAVTISFTGTDDRSGVEACDGPVTLSGEGAGQRASGTCTDLAGNVSEPVVEAVNIDVTAPAAHARRSPAANASGWNNTNVTVAFDGEDALSGVFSCSADVVLSDDGANQSGSGRCEDNAGNVSAPAASEGINIDRTPPVLSSSRSEANVDGWNNAPVTAEFVCSDALSGVSVGPRTPQVVAGEGRGQSLTATCSDRAGNTATARVENVNIDLTPPVAAALVAPSPNSAGWNNTAVTVSFSGTDALSGIGACTANTSLAQEGTGQSASGACVDLAGNRSLVTASGINIDLTSPVTSALATPSPNAAGWNNTAVTVSFSGTDTLSGIGACTANTSLAQEGAGQSASGACTDLAGNRSAVTASGINIDLTSPVMACSATPDVIWPPNHLLVPVTNLVTLTDPLSEASFRLIAAANSEPDARVADDALGTDSAADIQGFELSTADTQGAVRAERNGSGPGRQYTFRYEAFDRAGNRAECTITVVVPHDMD